MRAQQKLGIAFRAVISGIVLLTLIAFMGLGKASATTAGNTFYIAANGSDANNGTSKTIPWLHAPGMPACSASCASYTPKPGDSFIFRGGDTWHFGNSGASPYTGGTWAWGWSGTSGNCVYEGSQTSCIYIGVDQTWSSGSTWSRPILTGDNPLTPNAGKWGDSVSSCAYQTAEGSGQDQMFVMGGQNYVIFDNFEMTGVCEQVVSSSSNGYAYGYDTYISMGSGTVFVANVYVHGWTHLPFSCSEPNGEPVGHCVTVNAINAGAGTGTVGPGVVIDGSDSDPGGGAAMTSAGYRIVKSAFRYSWQGEGGQCHDIHDNLWEYWASSGDEIAHGNVWECVSDASGSTPNVFYNNIMRHITPGIVGWWETPNATAPEYWFNNIFYDIPGGNSMDIDPSGGSSGNHQYLFNNTWEFNGGIDCHAGMTASNNQYITESGSQYKTSGCSIPDPSTELKMSHATSNTQGYTGSNTFSDYPNFGGPSPAVVDTCATETLSCIPTTSGNSTVGKGASWQSYCTTLAGFTSDPTDVDAANACQDDTTTACSYDATHHVVTCPARTVNARGGTWDIGSYEYNSNQGGQPNPPTGLTAVVQ